MQAELITPNESVYDRKLRMLRQLSNACAACSMCELGWSEAEKDGVRMDPHVFSNMNPVQTVMVIGQNPGWNELKKCEPFVGAAGANFDKEIEKHGLKRSDFYITNMVKCWTKDNAKPSDKHVERCEPFLKMEIALIKPTLVVTLGAVSFSRVCPGKDYQTSLGNLVASDRYGVNVFPVYHPSPMNLADLARREAYVQQMAVLCGIMKGLLVA